MKTWGQPLAVPMFVFERVKYFMMSFLKIIAGDMIEKKKIL